jgi:hypothetical protein
MGLLYAKDALEDVSYVLIEPVVLTQLGTAVSAPGSQAVTPLNLFGIYVGALLIVDFGNANAEVITVTAVAAPTFTATFANTHLSTAPVEAPTFPTGQTDHPLFTQGEMLQYLSDTQNDFLLKTRMVYNEWTVAIAANERYYDQPSDAIRMERVEVQGLDLLDTSSVNLDLENANWQADKGTALQKWFQDEIDTAEFGVYPLPVQNDTATIWGSQRGAQTLALTDTFLVPDPFFPILKYGVLTRAYSKDGEQRDPLRAQFFKSRYDFGVNLGQRFMEGVDVQNPKEVLGVDTFKRFPLYRSLYSV